MLRSCTPLSRHSTHTKLAQPATELPIKAVTIAQITPMKLTIDTGIDTRTIVSGIAEYYTPEELVGRQVLVLVNLEPRELKGVLSQGMILMAEDASGKLLLLGPDGNTNNGAIVG